MDPTGEAAPRVHDQERPPAVHDVAVIGAGIVGASLALALARAGARVALVEARARSPLPTDVLDERPIALSAASKRILEALGLWPAIAPVASPIARIHVSDRGYPGFARIEAAEMGVDALGHVAAARHIARACDDALGAEAAIELVRPARVTALHERGDAIELELATDSDQVRIHARLAVAADGSASPVTCMLGLEARQADYRQSAVSAVVATTRDHGGTAYERFTGNGPLALLPMGERHSGLVWTTVPEEADMLAGLEDSAFLDRLQRAFGTRLGGFVAVGSRGVHPLRAVRVREQVAGRAVLVGNAAHTLHPVAGQGLNLGMRDVAALAERVAEALRAGLDPGARPVLDAYQAQRRRDQDVVFHATDSLVRLFSNRLPGLGLARAAGLLAFDLGGPVKRAFARQAMGLAGAQGRMVRGLAP